MANVVKGVLMVVGFPGWCVLWLWELSNHNGGMCFWRKNGSVLNYYGAFCRWKWFVFGVVHMHVSCLRICNFRMNTRIFPKNIFIKLLYFDFFFEFDILFFFTIGQSIMYLTFCRYDNTEFWKKNCIELFQNHIRENKHFCNRIILLL